MTTSVGEDQSSTAELHLSPQCMSIATTSIPSRQDNARTEAANTMVKQIKRTGRGYRNHAHYQARILLRSARQTRRRSPLNQQSTTFYCG